MICLIFMCVCVCFFFHFQGNVVTFDVATNKTTILAEGNIQVSIQSKPLIICNTLMQFS